MVKRCIGLTILLVAQLAPATEIEGIQPAALDQPRVHVHLRREKNGKPLATSAKGAAEQTINITAFLDTGASGVMLSKTTASALGIKSDSLSGRSVIFHDVGVAGGDEFDVSEPLLVYLAPSGKNGEPIDASLYPISVGPLRLQMGRSAGLVDMLTGGLDVVGMPTMKGKVAVLDPRPVDTFGDTMRAGVLEKNDPRIPRTDRHVRLSYGSFERFTHTDPPTAKGPTLADNPFIGPSPTNARPNAAAGAGNAVAPIVVRFNGKTATGSFLLDTGAAASMISSHLAAKLGVTEVDGMLQGAPDEEQFSFTIGGVGGQKKSPGFRLDSLSIPTVENDPLIYTKAPLLVADITVEDPATKQKLTLDGVLGMNFFVATANVEESALMPDLSKLTAGPFDWIVFDEPAGVLGLKLKKEFAKPAPSIEIKPTQRRR